MDSNLMPDDLRPRPTDDLSALAWVQEELRRSLEAAHKALRRFVQGDRGRHAAPTSTSVDPAVLRSRAPADPPGRRRARAGRPAGGGARAARHAKRRCSSSIAKPHDADAASCVAEVERAVVRAARLPGAPARRQAGLAAVAVPAVPRRAGSWSSADRVHPADLWPIDWRWRESPSDPDVAPRAGRRRPCAPSSRASCWR